MIKVFNTKKLSKISPNIPIKNLKKHLVKEFSLENDNINIVFTTPKHIKELNRDYRETDEVTDVLSFNIDAKNILGEIYICPEYIIKYISIEERVEELYRLIIHGILHLQGFEHNTEFDKIDYSKEPMYIKQEQVLNKILKGVK